MMSQNGQTHFKNRSANTARLCIKRLKTGNKCSKLRSSPPQVFLGRGVLKIYRRFIGEHPSRNVISINLSNTGLTVI